MWDPTRKKKADVLKLTCHYLTLAVHLIERPDDGLINPKHVACVLKENICCV